MLIAISPPPLIRVADTPYCHTRFYADFAIDYAAAFDTLPPLRCCRCHYAITPFHFRHCRFTPLIPLRCCFRCRLRLITPPTPDTPFFAAIFRYADISLHCAMLRHFSLLLLTPCCQRHATLSPVCRRSGFLRAIPLLPLSH